MQKTSVYLSPEEQESLRRAAVRTGRTKSQLIREGVRWVTGQTDHDQRTFRSLGQGHGGGAPHRRWDAQELYRRVSRGR